MWAALFRWITGDLAGVLSKAYEAKLAAQNETEQLIADAAVKDIERQISARQDAKEIRMATSGFWEMRLITFSIALPFVLHLWAVSMDTVFRLGWAIPKFPEPFASAQMSILMSFFGLQVVGQGITAIASAIRGRR